MTADHAPVHTTPAEAGRHSRRAQRGLAALAALAIGGAGAVLIPRGRIGGRDRTGTVRRLAIRPDPRRVAVLRVEAASDVVDLVELLGAGALNGEIVGSSATPTGRGFWLVGADGGGFALGDARYLGSVPALQQPGKALAGRPLSRPITGIASSPSGRGYWLVAEDAGMCTFGDAASTAPFPGCCPRASPSTRPSPT